MEVHAGNTEKDHSSAHICLTLSIIITISLMCFLPSKSLQRALLWIGHCLVPNDSYVGGLIHTVAVGDGMEPLRSGPDGKSLDLWKGEY